MPQTVASPPIEDRLLSQRIDRLHQLDLFLIPSPEFKTLTLEMLRQQAPEELFKDANDSHGNSSPLGTPLLTPAGERHLFRSWNFLKYSVRAQLSKLKNGRSNTAILDQIEQLWQDAQTIRSQIVQSNLRLVVKLAHRYAPTVNEVDDFISEGNLILLNAAEKFDYSRGYRFSTYATHAVARHYFRMLHRRHKRRLREVAVAAENFNNLSAPEEDEARFPDKLAGEIIRRFDDCLNPREKVILEQRFGLDGEPSATLQTVAGSVGLSKERVRQLQRAALDKLQTLATELRLHPEACL